MEEAPGQASPSYASCMTTDGEELRSSGAFAKAFPVKGNTARSTPATVPAWISAMPDWEPYGPRRCVRGSGHQKCLSRTSTGQIRAAVSALVGEQAARGLSANVVSRLKRSWDEECRSWRRRSLADDWV